MDTLHGQMIKSLYFKSRAPSSLSVQCMIDNATEYYSEMTHGMIVNDSYRPRPNKEILINVVHLVLP